MAKSNFNGRLIGIALSLLGASGCAIRHRVAQEQSVTVPAAVASSSPTPAPAAPVASSADQSAIQSWCHDVTVRIQRYRWPEKPCEVSNWKVWGKSKLGRPLVYADFGNPDMTNTTLVFAMVHGDEFTPLFVALRLTKWLQDNMDVFPTARIVVVPLVNPDGFFAEKQSRFNANGVDLNRNFDTKDWPELALKNWKVKYKSDPRRFPGEAPGSEIETKFQVDMVKRLQPSKIISIHAPLNFFDYDGPTTLSLNNFSEDYVKQCQQLRSKVRAISGVFYPGSLGNYAGQERGIPTFTLELPTANPKNALQYWRRFKPGIRTVIDFKFSNEISKKNSKPNS